MTKAVIETRIIENIEIARDIRRITLQIGSGNMNAVPGQFVNLYLNEKSMLLPRPVSICRMEQERLELVYRVVGEGTRALSGYRKGDALRISTPLGTGYDLGAVFKTIEAASSGKRKIALVAGGLGIPPMLELAKTIRIKLDEGRSPGSGREGNEKGPRLIAALGFRDETFLIKELGDLCDEVYLATETGATGYRGNIVEMLQKERFKADYYLSCGPKPMLKALSEYCGRTNSPLQVSLEERMGCGYGACVGCTCKTKKNGETVLQKVCKDGPVFFGEEVVWE